MGAIACRAEALPAWADSGLKFRRPDGSPSGPLVELPEVADLSRRPIGRDERVNVRPCAGDLADEFREAISNGVPFADAREELERSLAEFDDRLRKQAAERERLGLDILAGRYERATDAQADVEDSFDEHIGTSVLALGAALIVAIDNDHNETIEGLNRAALRAIQRQLVGAIAADADRMLASALMDDRFRRRRRYARDVPVLSSRGS